MKIYLLMLTLSFSTVVFSDESCFSYEVKGTVEVKKDHLVLRIAPATRSEVKLKIPQSVQSKLLSYTDHFVKAELVIVGDVLNSDTKLVQVRSVERDLPDPLNANDSTYKNKKGKTACL